MAELVRLLSGPCGDIHILPIQPFAGENAHRVLVRGRKGSRGPAVLAPPLILHEKARRHTNQAEAILRGKQALVF
jgi:tRNA1(Val) A37 N6-methylase TrmN6